MAGEQRRSSISSERLLEELSVAVDTPAGYGHPGHCRVVQRELRPARGTTFLTDRYHNR